MSKCQADIEVLKEGPLGSTDLGKWHLDASDSGRHVWHYLGDLGGKNELTGNNPFTAESNQSFETKHWLGLDVDAPILPDPAFDPLQAAQNGFEYYKRMQSPDGHWAGEYGGPLFLLPGIVITLYVTQTPMPEEWKIECARYLANRQRDNGLADSGWGLHIEGPSTVFGTALNYVSLRLLGVGPDVPMMVKARNTLHQLGGAAAAPSWGKMWLSILQVVFV